MYYIIIICIKYTFYIYLLGNISHLKFIEINKYSVFCHLLHLPLNIIFHIDKPHLLFFSETYFLLKVIMSQ